MEKERQQRIAAGIPNETRGRIAGQRGFIDLTNQASLFPEFPPAESIIDTENHKVHPLTWQQLQPLMLQ